MTYKADKEPICMGSYKVREHEVIKKSSVSCPTVSVIVPIYNMESKGFLDDLLGSLDLQTLDDIELVLVDDCSSDNTLDRLIDYSRTHGNVTLIHSVKNGRQGAARNLGLEYAKGAYIGFVDGDDAVDRDYYREMFNLAVKNNADIVVAPLIISDDRLTPIGDKVWQVSNEFDGPITPESRSRLILSPAHIVCSIYKASLFASCHLRFPENVFFEDNPTTFRLLCAASSVYTLNLGNDTPCYYYRQSMGSTDHRKDISNQLIDDRITTSCMLFDDAVHPSIIVRIIIPIDQSEPLGYFFKNILIERRFLFRIIAVKGEPVKHIAPHRAIQPVPARNGNHFFKMLQENIRAVFHTVPTLIFSQPEQKRFVHADVYDL